MVGNLAYRKMVDGSNQRKDQAKLRKDPQNKFDVLGDSEDDDDDSDEEDGYITYYQRLGTYEASIEVQGIRRTIGIYGSRVAASDSIKSVKEAMLGVKHIPGTLLDLTEEQITARNLAIKKLEEWKIQPHPSVRLPGHDPWALTPHNYPMTEGDDEEGDIMAHSQESVTYIATDKSTGSPTAPIDLKMRFHAGRITVSLVLEGPYRAEKAGENR